MMMKCLVLLGISVLVSSALANSTYPDPFDGVDSDVCVNPLGLSDTRFFSFINHFNVLILGDINVTSSLRTSGPLAVNGQLTVAKSIVINTNQNSIPCGSSVVADDLGLYVRDFAGAGNTVVSGRVMIQSNTNTGTIYQMDASCTTQPFKDLYSGLTFLSMMASVRAITEYIWNFKFMPSHRLLADGTIEPHFPTFDQRFYSFTIGICSGTTCVHDDSVFWSDGNIITDPNWKGPGSASYPKNRMLIFNASQGLLTDFTASSTVFKRMGTGMFGGTILSVWSILADGSPLGQYSGQVVALKYDAGNIDSRIGDFSDVGGACQGDTRCWVPTNLTLPRPLGTTTIVKVETTTLRTKSTTSTRISSRAIATATITVTSTLTSFVTSTSYSVPQVTIAVPATTTATLVFIYEKNVTTTTREPTTLGTSITVPATSLTTTTSTTIVPTTTTTDTTTDTYFTYTLNETTATSTTDVSTSVSNTYDLTTVSTKV
ncbi:hypothetical protein MBANPS3_000309 [Mucor bainieri]